MSAKDSFGSETVLSQTASLESGRYPGLEAKVIEFDSFVRRKDVPVALSDGTTIYVDLYLPKGVEHAPALVAWSPYGKHGLKSLAMMPGADVDPAWVSPHVIWEGPDPAFWCARGYAIVSPDPRGAWSSEGTLTFQSRSEAADGVDLIEWIAAQPWSNGNVGMLGVSYLAISQWMIAARRPRALKAICPWEGLSDPYREVYFHGGIPETQFLNWWQPRSRFSLRPAEDIVEMARRHPMLDAYWQSKSIDLEAIEVPAFVVASWSDHGMHTRGTLEGFRRIGSKHKWLEVHGKKKWRHFWNPESVAKQAAFFDHFLLDKDTGIRGWPQVSIEIRENNQESLHYAARAWPDPDTERLDLYLDCGALTLDRQVPEQSTSTAFDTEASEPLVFSHTFESDTVIVGGSALHLCVTAQEQDDVDLFVGLRKRDAQGDEVGFSFYSTFAAGPVALGWLRASHREMAPESTALQPIHTHQRRRPLRPGEPTRLEIEIWPTGTRFRAGETLELLIGGRDLYRFNTGAPELGHETINRGCATLGSAQAAPSCLALATRPTADIQRQASSATP